MSKEEWKVIPDWPEYQVSDMGRAKSPNTILKPWLDKQTGYPQITLYNGIHQRRMPRRLHELVWITWKGPVPAGQLIHHKNHDKTDARLSNLWLMPRGQHTRHHYKHTRQNLTDMHFLKEELFDERQDEWERR